jgi:CheY-like chemotaxis protein
MNLQEEIKGMRILLIDGDEGIRDSMSMFFLGEGLSIDAVETAEEGLDALAGRHYDIIIIDYNLPGMDGLSFFRRIHALYPDSFKILMTAYKQELPAAVAELGVDECMQKPFSAKSIKDSLARCLEKGISKAPPSR